MIDSYTLAWRCKFISVVKPKGSMNCLNKIIRPFTKIIRIIRLCQNKKLKKLIDCICWLKGADETQSVTDCFILLAWQFDENSLFICVSCSPFSLLCRCYNWILCYIVCNLSLTPVKVSYQLVHDEADLWGCMMLRNDKMETAKLPLIKWTEWTRTPGNYIRTGMVIVRDFYKL